MTKKQPTQETKLEEYKKETEMKKVNLSTTILSNVITGLVVGVALFITGYFTSINIQQDARANVVSDIQTVKAVSKQ